MLKLFEVALPLLALWLLFSQPYAFANDGQQIVFQPTINIDLQGVVNAIIQQAGFLKGALDGLPGIIVELIKNFFESSLREFNEPSASLLQKLVAANPDPEPMKPWFVSMLAVVSSLYVLVLCGSAFLFTFSSVAPEKIFEAKKWLRNFFIITIFAAASFPLYKLLLEFSSGVANAISLASPEQFISQAMFSGMGLLPLLLFAFAIMFAAFTLFVRQVFLLVGAGLLPLAIFLYFTPQLSGWGRLVFNLLGACVAMQLADSAIIAASQAVASSLGHGLGEAMLPAFALLAVGFANITIAFYAVFKSAFADGAKSRLPEELLQAILCEIRVGKSHGNAYAIAGKAG